MRIPIKLDRNLDTRNSSFNISGVNVIFHITHILKKNINLLNSNEKEDVIEFCDEFNINHVKGYEMSVCKTKVPIEFGITDSKNLYVQFISDVQKDSIVGVRMNAELLHNFYGSARGTINSFKMVKKSKYYTL